MKIIPTWKRFKSWSIPTRFMYVVGVFTIIGVVSVFFLKDSRNNNIDSSTTNNVDSSTTNIFIDKGDKRINNDNSLVYSISGVENLRLENLIKQSSDITIADNSKNIIKITYTGQVKISSKNTESYIYNGGNVCIIINENVCYEFTNYKIDRIRPNPKTRIINELNRVISSYVEQNINEFSKKIIQCIKK